MNSIILYQSQTSEISIRVKAYFEGEKLIIEGYDIGSKVEELLGDSIMSIPQQYSLMREKNLSLIPGKGQ